MPKAADIEAALEGLPVLEGRTPETSLDAEDEVFAVLAETEECGAYAGSFSGESPWERHPNGDELVQVLKGETTLTILGENGEDVLDMSTGMMTIVPRGRWHKFRAPNGVTVMTMTPQPTDHSAATDPRIED